MKCAKCKEGFVVYRITLGNWDGLGLCDTCAIEAFKENSTIGMKHLYPDAPKIKGLTLEEVVKLREIMNHTWHYIADDCFVDDMGRPNRRKVFHRRDVVEMVVDADRMVTFADVADKAIALKYYDLPKKDQEKINKYAFPDARYGY